jgi:phage terminase large subunit
VTPEQAERAQQLLEQWVERYGPLSPLGELAGETFVREVFGAEPDEWQTTALRAFSRGERFISIVSCHGVGKTTLLAWLAWLHLTTRFPQKTAATAPTKSQLEDALLAEISAWHRKLPEELRSLYDVTKHRIEFNPAPGASFFAAKTARDENPEALQGIHSKNVLLLPDEASGVPEKVFEASIGSMSGNPELGEIACTVMAGNPVRTSGMFFESHHSQKDMWFRVHVTGVPGTQIAGHPHSYLSKRVGAEFVEQVRRQYGEDSNAFRVRACGLFPRSDEDTIIPFELIESAQKREITVPPNAPEIWGLDVARLGGDKNVLARRNRYALAPKIMSWNGRDLMQTTGVVHHEWLQTPAHRRPELILVDVIGLGAGVVDRLRELGLPARGINVSETNGVDPRYRNLRTELWFKGREWFAGKDRKLPERCECGKCSGDSDHVLLLTQELAAQRFDYDGSEGRVFALGKKKMRKLLRRSPDHADAFLLTFASEPAIMRDSSTKSRSWKTPLRRKRSHV